MKLCLSCREEKINSAFVRDKSRKDGLCNSCKECRSKHHARYYADNAEKKLVSRKEWGLKNTDQRKSYMKAYQSENAALYASHAARRREHIYERTPASMIESDSKCMTGFYLMRERVSDCLGITHHVDHVVPLRGKTVCGLHVPWNLCLLPEKINMSKSNKMHFQLGSL